MELQSAWCRLTIVFISCYLLVLMTRDIEGYPIQNPEHTLRNMQKIPQWHCLRYRRFDLVKRCRNYRMAQTSTHHEYSESYHIPAVAMGSPAKASAEK
ncbi:hypothetical protein L798_10476 [Zootermopsis nevadensis]|uniref:Secreted protein n=1 Tax=Zootermopsis nevadensis TaxID=136037 RepID=A0A067QYH2_ZOONE|nr:hypothetical protein L798_10476 [Zootermopsis nevadensis]